MQSAKVMLLALMSRFHTDPSGTFVTYEAKAIGSGSEGAQTSLQVMSSFINVPLVQHAAGLAL